MYFISKRLRNFSASHRLIKGYQGKCKHLHGHDYVVELSISGNKLDQYDFVFDFDEVKQHFDAWVQANWDHATLVSDMDEPLLAFVKNENQKHFVIPGNRNTTAECLAEFLFHQFSQILANINKANQRGLAIKEVKVFETPGSAAGYTNQS